MSKDSKTGQRIHKQQTIHSQKVTRSRRVFVTSSLSYATIKALRNWTQQS